MNNQVERSMKVSLKVSLDPVDIQIIDAMSSFRFLKVHEIRTILEYNGTFIGYGELSSRLKILSVLSIVEKQKTSRLYSYKLSGEFEFSP